MHLDNFNFELKRKTFHLYSLILPLSYMFVGKLGMCVFLVLLTGFTFYIDISRNYNPKIKELVEKIFGQYLRDNEKSGKLNLSGASFMALGFLVSCLFFSKGLAITSWLILIISDCLAAIVGMKFGTPLYNEKSLAGSGAFFASSILISIITYFYIGYSTSFLIIIISSATTAATEFFTKELKINDNFLIPFIYCLVTSILTLFL